MRHRHEGRRRRPSERLRSPGSTNHKDPIRTATGTEHTTPLPPLLGHCDLNFRSVHGRRFCLQLLFSGGVLLYLGGRRKRSLRTRRVEALESLRRRQYLKEGEGLGKGGKSLGKTSEGRIPGRVLVEGQAATPDPVPISVPSYYRRPRAPCVSHRPNTPGLLLAL